MLCISFSFLVAFFLLSFYNKHISKEFLFLVLSFINNFSCDIPLDVYELFITFAAKYFVMTIKILSAKNFAIKLKATIQASGRLGFTAETATVLDLKSGKFAKFAKDDENNDLYLIIINEGSEDAFSVRESSGYFYVPTKVMFDALGFDYENGNIMFDLVRQPSLDNDLQGQVYRMKQRTLKYRKEKKDDITEP